MRLTFKNIMQCFAIVGMVTLSSCSKDETDEPGFVSNSFSIDGQKYNTLQEAVKAAAKTGAVIKMTSSTTGDGFIVTEGEVNIDFGPYTYQLNPGKAIIANGGVLAMTGNGGTLKGVGTVIRSSHSGLDIEGNLNINGDIDVESMDYCGFWEDYSGVYSGNIKLNDTYMFVEAEKAELNIGTLHPLASSINVTKAKSVSIDNVTNVESLYPVRTDAAGMVSVKTGAEVHVHKYAEAEPASCASTELMTKACTECDHFDSYIDENNTKEAACDVHSLHHNAAVAASNTTWGSVEYWECLFCGKCYADSHASTGLDPMEIMIAPKGLIDLSDLVDEENEAVGAKSRGEASNTKLEGAINVLGQALELAGNIFEIVQGDPSPEEKLLELFTNMDKKLDAILGKLDGMQTQLNKLSSLVLSTSGEAQLNPRLTALNNLSRGIDGYGTLLKSELEKAKKAGKKIDKDVLVPLLKGWNGENNRYLSTIDLTASYGSQGVGLRGVEDMWRDVLRPQVMWEHEGLNARKVAMTHDIDILQISAILSSYYITFAKDYSTNDPALKKELMKVDLKNLRTSLDNYFKAVKAAKALMEEREKEYMVLCDFGNAGDVTFSKALGNYNVYNTLEANKANVRFTYKTHTACNTADIAELVGVNKVFDETLIQKLMAHYKTSNPIQSLVKSGFSFDTRRPVMISLHKYGHYMEDRHAQCGNWDWISKFSKNDDWIWFRGLIFNTDIKPGQRIWGSDWLIWQANISNESGQITNWGKQAIGFGGQYLSVVPVE